MSTPTPKRKKEAASRVEQLMIKNVRVCRPSDSLNIAAQILWECDCGAVPVVAEDGSNVVVGMLTDRDISMAAYTQGRSLHDATVASAMSRDLRACTVTTTLEEAAGTMQSSQVRRLPVVDGSRQLLGVITLADLAREAARHASTRSRSAAFARVGETLAAIVVPPSPEGSSQREGSGETRSSKVTLPREGRPAASAARAGK